MDAEPNEQLLLDKARALDEEALAQVHDRYYGSLYQYMLYRVGEHQLAEDLTGDVFLRLLDALRERSAPRYTLRGWLYRVASNVVNDHYRRHYRASHVELDENIAGNHHDPVAKMATKSEWAQLRGGLEQLTDEQREVIALRFGQELAIREVAELMNKSEGAIKQLQARAIAALARYLEKEE